jgi:hypothetical protein
MTRARDMANLGSQAGSGLDASDITSGVLPSGVTGGSGLTALGTITAGNISHADIVYPVGHVLQVVHNNSSSQFDIPAFSAGGFATSGFACSITPKTTTSKILFTFDSGIASTNSDDNWFHVGLIVSGSSITDTNFGISATTPLVRANPNTTDSHAFAAATANILHAYSQSNTTDALTFTIHMGSQAAYSAGIMHLGGRNNGESRYSMMTLMEISQ